MMQVGSVSGHGQVNLRAHARFPILAAGDLPDNLFIHEIRQTYIIEEPVNLLTEVIPEFMRETTLTLLAVTRTVAARGFNRFVNGRDNLGDCNPVGAAAE